MRRAALALCLTVCGTAHAADDGKLYKDQILRFQIRIAKGWTTEPVLQLQGETVLKIKERRPLSKDDTCIVSIEDYARSSGKPQAELNQWIRESVRAPEPSPLSMAKLTWFSKVAKDEMVDLNGHTARVLEVDNDAAPNGSEERWIYALEFLAPGRVFSAECIASADHYAALRPSFLQMVHSLRALD